MHMASFARNISFVSLTRDATIAWNPSSALIAQTNNPEMTDTSLAKDAVAF
jgi:hypothetical protein